MQKNTTMTYQEAKNQLAAVLLEIGRKHARAKVFQDFMEMSALAISNSMDLAQYDVRETRYLSIAGQYDREELDGFASALALLTEGLQAAAKIGRLRDLLGELYVETGMNDGYKAQVFTPQHLADLMGILTLGNTLPTADRPAGAYDPCCGAGVMTLGFVNALIAQKRNYHNTIVVEAVDIDPLCVHMCYIQLSLYGVPARVVHGNLITQETFSTWYTPMYILQGHLWRGKKKVE